MRGGTLAVTACLLLAGCTGGTTADDGFDDFGNVDVKDGLGVVRGIVLDPSIVPIQGALVEVQNHPLNATTNANGAFLIKDVPPGTHFLRISKPGYETIQASAEVVANDAQPPLVRVQLPPLPGSEPRYVPFEWGGYIGCTYRRWDPPSGGYGASCPAVNTLWPQHDFLVDYELDQVPDYVTSDQVWKSTQHFGGEMSFNLRRTDGNCDTVDIEGTSPLHLSMGPEEIALHDDRCRWQGGFGPDMPLRVIVFTAHLQETEPPTGGWGFGLQLEQDFNVYTHVFYNYAPPADWRFTDDPSVPAPP